jgi:hypothetical protein
LTFFSSFLTLSTGKFELVMFLKIFKDFFFLFWAFLFIWFELYSSIDIGESYALGSLVTVLQREVNAILACSDYCRNANMHNMTLCIYVLIARLRCWLYPHIQFRLNFYTSAGYHCKISLITTGWDCFECQVNATLRPMRRLIGWLRLPLLWTGALCSIVSFSCPGYE